LFGKSCAYENFAFFPAALLLKKPFRRPSAFIDFLQSRVVKLYKKQYHYTGFLIRQAERSRFAVIFCAHCRAGIRAKVWQI